MTPEEFTRLWVQREIYALLSDRHGLGSENPEIAVGQRGNDLVLFGPGGKQIIVLIEEAQ